MSQLNFDLSTASLLLDSSEQFPVDFDRAWQWLGYSQKSNCLALLKRKFVVQVDFHANEVKLHSSKGGRPLVEYYLTIECFKMLGMMADTDQGQKVREYFLECERIAKNQISTTDLWQIVRQQNQRIELLQSELTDTIELLNRNAKIGNKIAKTVSKIENMALSTSHLVDRLTIRNLALEGELNRLNHPYGKYYTVAGYLNLLKQDCVENISPNQIARVGKLCTEYCQEHGIDIVNVYDMRYGTVGAYPETIIFNSIPRGFYL